MFHGRMLRRQPIVRCTFRRGAVRGRECQWSGILDRAANRLPNQAALEGQQAICHAEDKMTEATESAEHGTSLVLGIDTCGPSGSVALVRLGREHAEELGQIELAGKTYSATLVTAVGELLAGVQVGLGQVAAIVVTHGPGSFTGVRVGLSAVKGLAEPGEIPVVAVSRLAVLAQKAAVESAALDAHRQEVFVRVIGDAGNARELLAGRADLEAMVPVPERVAACDDAAIELLKAVWPGVELVRVQAPTARDAIRLAVAKIRVGEFADLALLDGHYLRRSDAEIFGESARAMARRG
jgi:tRNA threonylcarbamoyladenosine biosynthesis protein TsaB